ncbi:DUF1194 domain-containing protein [Microbaculum marinum]|uniref:DUF1194 domain-containing protein n=1 Tax=Microbaculum marinum TaxID=1764581 RepID=A0AAW9RSX5_9HYPH
MAAAVLFGTVALSPFAAGADPTPFRSVQTTAEEPVDLELVIAVDVSLSMDVDEQALQREGYVKAFLDPMVVNAIEQGIHGKIAVAYVEWAGSISQYVVIDWVAVDGKDSAAELSALLAEAPISRLRRTSISGALTYSGQLFDDNGYRGMRRVIDVSGDGPNNQGGRVDTARDAIIAGGVTINGLPFVPDPTKPLSLFDLPDLDIYYEDCVIGGAGSFSLPVYSAREFAEAIRNKLVLEIAGTNAPEETGPEETGPKPVPASAAATRIPCDVGERQWQMFMDGDTP